MNLKFSVVTPSYCQGHFIDRTIQSVLVQRSETIWLDYLVCDGGSNDQTLKILESYSGELRWISEPDQGQADAVNKGIRMTTGDIIAWINSDDIYYPDTFEIVHSIFQNSPDTVVIYGDADHINEEGHYIEDYPTAKWDYKRLKETCFLCQPAVFFRRSLVQRLGDLDSSLKYCMDYELWLRWGQHVPFYYLPQKLAGSRLYASNKTLGQRLEVHYEINDMLYQKFGRVPNTWIFGYAHVKVERVLRLDRTKPLEDIKFIEALIHSSLKAFWHWNRWINPTGLVQILGWWFRSKMLWIKILLVRP